MRIEKNNLIHSIFERQSVKMKKKASPVQDQLMIENLSSKDKMQGELLKERESLLNTLSQQIEITRQQSKEEQEKLKVLLTCFEISRRIISGDKVPSNDHEYLRKHDNSLYARSITLRFPKDNPYEYDQISPGEENEEFRSFSHSSYSVYFKLFPLAF